MFPTLESLSYKSSHLQRAPRVKKGLKEKKGIYYICYHRCSAQYTLANKHGAKKKSSFLN